MYSKEVVKTLNVRSVHVGAAAVPELDQCQPTCDLSPTGTEKVRVDDGRGQLEQEAAYSAPAAQSGAVPGASSAFINVHGLQWVNDGILQPVGGHVPEQIMGHGVPVRRTVATRCRLLSIWRGSHTVRLLYVHVPSAHLQKMAQLTSASLCRMVNPVTLVGELLRVLRHTGSRNSARDRRQEIPVVAQSSVL